jgi:hypothetical protein
MNSLVRLLLVVIFGMPSLGYSQEQNILSIEGVNVISMTGNIVMPNQRILVRDGIIEKIESSALPLQEKSARKINAAGKYIIPGLSEMHYHFRTGNIDNDIKLFLSQGITTVRNMSEGKDADQVAIREKCRSGALPPVNYFTTGAYLQARDLPTKNAIDQVVKNHKERGYDFLKLADNLDDSLYLYLLQKLQENNIPLIGHAQRNKPLEYSLRMKSLEHLEEFLYLSPDGNKPLTTLSNTELHEIAKQVADSRIYIGTTLVNFEFINNCVDDERFRELQQSSLANYIPAMERENFLTDRNDYRKLSKREFNGVPAPKFFHDQYLWIKKFVRILNQHQVPLLIGSDTYGMVVPGFSLHHEFELLQESGLSPYEILHASTVNAARYLDTYSMEGTIAKGKHANLVILDENPLDDIRNTQKIAGLILKGKYYDREGLERMKQEVRDSYK